jgi:hypothetical protein
VENNSVFKSLQNALVRSWYAVIVYFEAAR